MVRVLKVLATIVGVLLLIVAAVVLFIPFLLVTALFNRFSSRVVRRQGRELQFPVIEYLHPESQRRVALIGVMHFADADYYRRIGQLITSLPDRHILFEGVGRITEEETVAFSDAERTIATRFERVFAFVDDLKNLLGLTAQRDGLAYKPSWFNTDMPLCSIVKKLAHDESKFLSHLDRVEELRKEDKDGTALRNTMNWILGMMPTVSFLSGIVRWFSKDMRNTMHLILEERNEIAVKAILEHAKTHDVAAIWGAQHLIGMEKLLKHAGYCEDERLWLTAYHVRKYPLVEVSIGNTPSVKKT